MSIRNMSRNKIITIAIKFYGDLYKALETKCGGEEIHTMDE